MGGGPTGLYPCKPFGPNDWIYLITVTDAHWDALCLAIERPDLIVDPRIATGMARLQNTKALYEEIATWTRERTKHEAMKQLGDGSVPCSATLDTRDLYEDFVEVLSGVDSLVLLEVYSAGEEPIPGADSRHLCRSIRNRGQVDPIFVEGIDGVPEIVKDIAQPGDIVITQGAGNVGLLAVELAKRKLK